MTARGVIASVLAVSVIASLAISPASERDASRRSNEDQSDARRGLQAKENSRDNAVNSLQNRWRKPLSFPISK
jgi:hypothetical protein